MKKFKFKSLTMRIWTIYTAVILVIVCSLSIFYLVAYSSINQKAKINDLKVAHNLLLEREDLFKTYNLNGLKNLKGSKHFIVTLDSVGYIQNMRTLNFPKTKRTLSLRKWLASFITFHTMEDSVFVKECISNEYIFIISTIKNSKTDDSYLISYIPDNNDNSLLVSVFITSLVFIIVGFFASKLIANYISKPLRELEAFTTKIAKKKWDSKITIKSDDEFGRLAKSMISMQKTLERSDNEEKMFLQSISHGLKTPVMVILSHAQSILDGIDIESTEETAEIIKNEALRLDKKIKQILYLNTLDFLLEQNNDSSFQLDDLIKEIINRFESINNLIEWNLCLEVITVIGNKSNYQTMIENILDNALRFVKEKINISLKKTNTGIILDIYNDGPPISLEAIDKIFDHLYKDKKGNFGLGLTISKKLIDFYHGNIYAVNRSCGVSFIIELPEQE